ncbi:hypothetical protein GCM10023185_30250 [Hymenobacter saemangeumensis]|uniref:T9SS type A sorting domain-containing protein n=1 Tax=Hymenobacter saemangeumensis TaxID=1084522 RepID=A0ABP8ILZ6_9BACT
MRIFNSISSAWPRLALLAGLGLTTAHAQAQAPAWTSVQRSSSTPGANTGANGLQIAVGADGSQYINGSFGGDITFGSITRTGMGGFVAKRNAAGTVLWMNHLQPDSNGDYYSNVAVDAAGNVYVTGYFNTSLTLGTTVLTSPGDDSYLVKYDAQGVLQWVRQGGSQGNYAQGIATDAAGNIIIAGDYAGTVSFGGTSLSGGGLFMYKFSPAGSVLQASQVGVSGQTGGSLALVNDLALDAAGNAYLTGTFAGSLTLGTSTLSSAGGDDMFVCKLNAAGNNVWARRAGGADDDGSKSVAVDPSGNVVISGFSDYTFLGTSETSSIYVARYSAQGVPVWSRQITPTVDGSYRGEAVAYDGRGGFYVTGGFQGAATFGATTLSAVGEEALFVVRYDGQGNAVWADKATNANASSASIGLGVAADANGNAYVTGAMLGTVQFGSLAATTGGIDAFVARLSAGTVLASGPAAATLALEAYPNPATGSTTLRLPAGGGHLLLTDALGRTVREQALPTAAGACPVSLAGLAPGLYQLRATLGNGQTARAKVQVR